MSDEQVDIEFDVDDKVTPKLSRMERAVGKLGGAVDRASSRFMSMAGQFAGIGAFFALGPAIEGAKNYIGHLDKISDLTGIAADRVGGISNALEDSGVSAAGVENVFARLVKKGAQLGEGNKALIKMARGYGVQIKEGPEAALMAVSGLLEKGKINAGQMQRILGVSASDAADLADALAQGPGSLAEKIEEATKKNAAFSDEAMSNYQRFQNASSAIHTAWNRMTASVLIKFAPVLERLATKMEHSIDKWAAKAEKFANFLADHMDEIIDKAKVYAKIMLVTAGMHKLGFNVGGLMQGGAGIMKKVGGGLKAGYEVFSMGASKGGLQVIGQMVKGLFSLRPILNLLMRFGPVGIALTLLLGAFRAFQSNIGGIADRLKSLFGSIWDKLQKIGGHLSKLFSSDGPLGKLLDFVGVLLLNAIERLGEALNAVLWVVEKILSIVPDILAAGPDMGQRARDAEEFRTISMRQIERAHLTGAKRDEALARMNRRINDIMAGTYKIGVDSTTVAKAKPEVPKSGPKGPQVYQDFRGSRFDIQQAFSDGYDPDRVAVAFSNDIANLGEKKVQSGFAPLFSVR